VNINNQRSRLVFGAKPVLVSSQLSVPINSEQDAINNTYNISTTSPVSARQNLSTATFNNGPVCHSTPTTTKRCLHLSGSNEYTGSAACRSYNVYSRAYKILQAAQSVTLRTVPHYDSLKRKATNTMTMVPVKRIGIVSCSVSSQTHETTVKPCSYQTTVMTPKVIRHTPSYTVNRTSLDSKIKVETISTDTCTKQQKFHDSCSQTNLYISSKTPRKEALRKQLRILRKTGNRRQKHIVKLRMKYMDKLSKFYQTSHKNVEKIISEVGTYLHGDSFHFVAHQIRMSQRHRNGRRYSDEIRLHSLALYNSSPKAYAYLANIFALPSKVTRYNY
jgi:hypothetical protein